MFVLSLAGVASLIAGSVSWDRAQPHSEEVAVVPSATDDAIVGNPVGAGRVFDKTTLDAKVSTAAPGIHINLSTGEGTHTWTVHGFETQFVLEATPSSPASGTIVLPPGTYDYYCDIPGHEPAGMKGVLTVPEDPAAQPLNAPAGGAEGETTTSAG
jgi:plastocyanin